jgi:hypothetical protein
MADTFRTQAAALAEAARAGLLAMPGKDRGLGFESFPRGTCGHVSELIGRIVFERTGIYVCGGGHPALKPQQSHAWLEVRGLVVDLTHDQFQGTGLLGWVFEHSPWHALFERETHGLCLSPAQWGQYPHAAYAAMNRACGEVA